MLSSSSRASDAGIRVKPSALSVERWSAGSKRRRLSISSPKKSSRSACSSPAGKDVDQRAAHRIFAMLGDGVGALIAERIELLDSASRSIRSPAAMRRVSWRIRNGVRSALGRGVDGGDQQLRLVALRLERVQRRQPLGHHPQRRRSAVVGQAIPRRGRSAPRVRARTAERYRRARASPPRRRRSRPRGRPCRSVRARARSAASHGRKPGGTPASVSGSLARRTR